MRIWLPAVFVTVTVSVAAVVLAAPPHRAAVPKGAGVAHRAPSETPETLAQEVGSLLRRSLARIDGAATGSLKWPGVEWPSVERPGSSGRRAPALPPRRRSRLEGGRPVGRDAGGRGRNGGRDPGAGNGRALPPRLRIGLARSSGRGPAERLQRVAASAAGRSARRGRLPQGRRRRPRGARPGRDRPRPPPRPRMGGVAGRSASRLRRALRLRRRASGLAGRRLPPLSPGGGAARPSGRARPRSLAFFAAEPPAVERGQARARARARRVGQDERGDPDRPGRCGATAASIPGPRARSCASSDRS